MHNFIARKAGLENLEQLNQTIALHTRNSEFYRQEQQKLELVQKKVQKYNMKVQKKMNNREQWQEIETRTRKKIVHFSNQLQLDRCWVHVDMDMFYAAIEIRDNQELREKPLAVGDTSMIQTSNYVARRFGVKSGLPGFIALKLCPELVFVKPDMDKYKQVSAEIKEVLQRKFDRDLESPSLDEFSLDVTEWLERRGLQGNELAQVYVGD